MYIGKSLGLFLGILIFGLKSTTSLVKVNNDEFHGYLNGIYYNFKDSTGASWELPANKNRLEILLNDEYQHSTFATCTKMHGQTRNVTSPSKSVTFKEMAMVSATIFK